MIKYGMVKGIMDVYFQEVDGLWYNGSSYSLPEEFLGDTKEEAIQKQTDVDVAKFPIWDRERIIKNRIM